jgi:hypothetical protein
MGVVVRWSAIGEYFRIERATEGGAWEVAGTATAQWYFYELLQTEQQVCYRVINYNTTAEAAPSNVACTTPLASPSELTGTQVAEGVIELNWINNSSVAERLEVWRFTYQSGGSVCCPDSGGCDGHAGIIETYEVLAVVSPNTTSLRVAGAFGQDGCNYSEWIEVRAVKDGGYAPSASLYLARGDTY